jgi:hypothetical protein
MSTKRCSEGSAPMAQPMKRPIVPIPAATPPAGLIACNFERWLVEQVTQYPEVPLPRVIAMLLGQLSVGLCDYIGIDATAQFITDTLQQVQFLETIEEMRRHQAVLTKREDEPHERN